MIACWERFASLLDVAESLRCSALTDSDRFWSSVTSLRFRNSVGPTPRNLLGCLTVTVSCGTWYRVCGTAFVCIMSCLLTSIACLQIPIIDNARAFTLSVTEVHRFWVSAFLLPRGTIRVGTNVSLFHAEIFLFRNSGCLF